MSKIVVIITLSVISGLVINYFLSINYVLHTCSYDNNYLTNYYSKYQNMYLGDSGIDMVIPYNISISPYSYHKIEYYTRFVMTNNINYHKSYSYYLYARSSLQKYPLIFVNGVGIIDAGYRGNLSSLVYNPNNFTVNLLHGYKIAQICANDLSDITVIVNCDVPSYGMRGSNGFGSSS